MSRMEQEQEQAMNINSYEEQEPEPSEAAAATGAATEEIENAVDPVYISPTRQNNQQSQTEGRPLANMNINSNSPTEYSRNTEEIIFKNTSKMNNQNLVNVYHNYFREGASGRTRRRKHRKTQKRKGRKQNRKTRSK